MKDLNKLQREAVKCKHKNILINAGPGTGKTRTLIYRLKYLLESGTGVNEVVALTFTNKAAEEMKSRLRKMGLGKLPFVGTFHGFMHKILGNSEEAIELVSEDIIRELEKIFKKKGLREISRKKLLEESDGEVENYNEELRLRGVVDYDDLLIKGLEFVKKNKKIISKYKHVLVDEFQDTGPIQYKFLKIFDKANMFVIGDPNQSIYSFRGVGDQKFDEFENFSFEKTYRFKKDINKLSEGLVGKKLKSVSGKNGKVYLVWNKNEYAEAKYIVNKIIEKVGGTDLLQAEKMNEGDEDINFSDFVVMYRVHRVGYVLAKAFSESGIPYQVVSRDNLEDYDERADKVSLMSMHASKGLEFKYVFICGFEDGLIPFEKAIEEGNEDEEKRLLYVAVTRAIDELYVMEVGRRFGKKTKKSRFRKLLNNKWYEEVRNIPKRKKMKPVQMELI